jgi:predicted SnoaL-like aldol condensation-catalyzing enzyme
MGMMSAEETKAMVLKAFDTLFNKRDYAKAAEFWSESYIQHSAHIPPGRDGLFNLVRATPATMRYENSVIVADGNYVMLHGRFTGRGAPRAWAAADVLRIENGLLAEHWDVLADEVTAEESKSGRPMVGNLAAKVESQSAAAGSSPTVEEARRIVAPLYEALNEPNKKDVGALLAKCTHADYRSYHTNEDSLTREQLAEVFKGIGAAVPNLHWEIKDLMVNGDTIIVRGKATGTPTCEFWGVKPTGKSFNTMSIDIFAARDGKLASAFHVENWSYAVEQQLKK